MRTVILLAFIGASLGACNRQPATVETRPSSGASTHHSRSADDVAPILVTSRNDLIKHVGQLITIRGMVGNSKIANILGVDVSSDSPDLRGQMAEATGILKRYEITQAEFDRIKETGMATRGPGAFYRLIAINSDYDAQVRPINED